MKKRATLIALVTLALLGCKGTKPLELPKEPFDRSAVLARYGDETLTIGELVNAFSQFGKIEKMAKVDKAENETPYVTRVIEETIRSRKLTDRARELGYDKAPDFKHFRDYVKFEKTVQQYLTREILPRTYVDDAAVKGYYDKNKDNFFTTPRKIKFKWIFVKKDKWGSWEAAQERADLVAEKLRGDDSFEDLIYTYSDSEEKDRLKEKGWFSREDMDSNPALQEAAFSLKEVGELVGPIKSDNGFHFVMLTGISGGKLVDFERVKENIRTRLLVERMEGEVARIVEKKRGSFKISEHKEILQDADAGDDSILFSVNGLDYSMGMFKEMMMESDSEIPEDPAVMYERQVRNAVLYNISTAKGYGEGIERMYRAAIDDYLSNVYVDREVAAKIEIPESKILEEYEKNGSLYQLPVRIHAYWIYTGAELPERANTVKTIMAMQNARKKAWGIYNRLLLTGESFADAAKEYSDDPETASKGGDLGIYSGGARGHLFDKAAFALQAGEISHPVELKLGYAIIWAEDRLPGRQMTYEEASVRIKDQFREEELRIAQEDLSKQLSSDVEIDEAGLQVVADYLLQAARDTFVRSNLIR